MSGISGYSDIFNLGHKALEHLFDNPVIIEEKVDGSQFSFGIYETEDNKLELRAKSHNQSLDVYNTGDNNMFRKALDTVIGLQELLPHNWTYRAEYLSKPRHNGLAYNRVPEKNLIIYDIDTGNQNYLSYVDKKAEAERLGLECVPLIAKMDVEEAKLFCKNGVENFKILLNTESILGGQKIEGVVIKNYEQYAPDKKVLMGKHVSEEFKEVQRKHWKEDNPTNKDVISLLGDELKTEARWNKAIIHLREQGLIKDDPSDIGLLMKEVSQDVLKEEKEYINKKLFEYAWKQISRSIVRGLPEWYKNKLVEKQFGHVDKIIDEALPEIAKAIGADVPIASSEEFKKALDKCIKDHDETLRKLDD